MPAPYFLPEINLVVMSVTTVLYTLGCILYGVKRFSKKFHFKLSFAGWISTLVFFLVYMLQRSLTGTSSAPPYLQALYIPFLIIHIIAATITLILPGGLLIFGLKKRKGKTERSMKKIGITNIILWYLTFISGIVVYLCLHVL